LERFVALADVYGVAPDRLLMEALRETRGEAVLIDLARLEDLPTNERALVAAFVREVAQLRDIPIDKVTTLRTDDVEILATASRLRPEDLASRLEPHRSRR
jgi:hypothetical protein